jgi:hypothetical protein
LEVKYGWKGLEIMNNLSYRNFSRFELEFELKFGEFLWVEIEGKSLKNLGTFDFKEIWPPSSLIHLIARKNQFPSKEDQKMEFHSKRKFGLISR